MGLAAGVGSDVGGSAGLTDAQAWDKEAEERGGNQYIPEDVIQAGEATAAAALDEAEMLTPEEAEQKAAEEQAERLRALGSNLKGTLSEWKAWRQGLNIDKDWAEDLDFYNGKDNQAKRASEMMDSVEQGYPVTTREAKPTRSTVFIGITRTKTNSAEARLADILLPTDDRNWGIKPTPRPELAVALRDETPVPPQQPGAPALPGQAGAAPMQGPQAMQPPVTPPGQPPVGAGIDPNAPQLQAVQPTGMPAPMPQPQGPMQPLNEQGEILKKKDVAYAIQKQAKQASDAMQLLIEDQLNECDYNGETRKVLHWAAVLGTGVLKGPLVANRYKKAWVPFTDVSGESTYVLELVKETAPVSVCVDPRTVYTDPSAGEYPNKGRGIFEVDQISAKEVRELAKQPGYLKQQLRSVLRAGPKPSSAVEYSLYNDENYLPLESFERITYWGEVTVEDLRCSMSVEDFEQSVAPKLEKARGDGEAGYATGSELQAPGQAGTSTGRPSNHDDSLISFSACIIMINGEVVKTFLNPLETESLPYDFFQWEKVNDRPWGQGVPRLMNSQQRVVNASWRMMMDNAGVSAGPQIVMNRTDITPADGIWEITGRKLWFAKGGTADVTKAMQVFQIDSQQAMLQGIIEMAMKLVDDDTGVPAMMQGDKTNAPETLGGMQMLMNAANVVLRRLVKRFDDDITRPHISRYYDFNMEHSADESVKGDFNVDARGTSALLVRDIQNQALMQLLAAYATNPMMQASLKFKELLKKALAAQHIDTEQLLFDDAEIDKNLQAQSQGQQAAPQVEAAKIRAESQVVVEQARAKADLAEVEQRRVMAEQNNQFNLQKLELEMNIAMLKYASEQKQTIEQIRADLAKAAMDNRTKKELYIAESTLKQQLGSGI